MDVKDSNGNLLADGETPSPLIKDLKAGRPSRRHKRGTVVKNPPYTE